jgi:hypothetical protein
MGGSRRVDVNTPAMLIDTCGHGSIGCHWYAEQNREWAQARGLILPKVGVDAVSDPTLVPVVLPSGRRVILGNHGCYEPVTDGIPYALDLT